MLLKSKQNRLEALNRQTFRLIHWWLDATNAEVAHLPKYRSIDNLTQIHWSRIIQAIIRTNPSVLAEFIQHKIYMLYMTEYYQNPALIKEKKAIVNKGRTSKKILNLFHNHKYSLFGYTLCF